MLLPALVLVALALPSSASAQATRTWVSGVGDDANPCSRTAPCKTFAGAISKTANGGEINCLDPGGFGGVTITKSLTIKCHYTEGGVLVSGTNAIVINAANTDKVTLKGLDINGIGTGAQTSLVGIKVLNASRVDIIDTEVYRFKAGVAVVPTGLSTTTRVLIANSHIHNNGIGVITAPGNNTITDVVTKVRNSEIDDNTCGIVAGAGGTNASTPDAATNCGTALPGAINKLAETGVDNSSVAFNGTGVFARGTSGRALLAYSEIVRNSVGMSDGPENNGVLRTTSPATNVLDGNASGDVFNSTSALAKRAAKKARSRWSKNMR